ncbi:MULTISPECIES: YaaA family protein [unclassified Agromyces]|uniref:YaaA family protein n=1 Tax=unclassified Agromyces TaxID=2639701 RepID=UPI003014993F
MLVLLPPSETKRDGGTSAPLELGELSFPELAEPRATVVAAVRSLADDPDAMMRALKLGPRQAGEVQRNRSLLASPTMAAVDRYTGVLFDALDAPSLDAAARGWAAAHLSVHSALFGLVGALDAIPAYRLSHDSRLPGLRLKTVWRGAVSQRLDDQEGLIIDLRSEGYADLGPAPSREDSVYVRVVSADGQGRRRALNHFNKRAKGLFARALLEDRPDLGDRDDLTDWARGAGFALVPRPADPARPGELELVA